MIKFMKTTECPNKILLQIVYVTVLEYIIMALSTPNTPKNNFITPRRAAGIAGPTQTPKYLNLNNETPTSAKVRTSREKTSDDTSNIPTPRRSGNLHVVPQTPKCYTNVTIETPVSCKRSSKEKFDEISNLRVAVRIRPMNARELSCVGVTDIIKVQDNELIIRASSANLNMSTDHIFQYDHVFWSCDDKSENYASQEDVFLAVGEPLLYSAFRGYNACLFAYGQTGSGKSYSMMGQYTGDFIDIDVNAGVTPRFCKQLFSKISSLSPSCTATVEVSYFEIYNEKIHDLLAVSTSNNRTALKVREHPAWGPYVVDLSVHIIKSYTELRQWLQMGNKNRITAATAMNEKSSRSHSIFSIEICLSEGINEGDSCRRSKVSLIDLAGSERLGNMYSNDEKIRQGVSINKSLLTLGKVISALAEQKKGSQFVPYRESVLTWLLRESLGGNSLTSMLATITPASTNVDETLATLRYACQARAIVNRARINENPHDKLIRELRAEVDRLRALRQDYERNSFSSVIHIDDSTEHEQELEALRGKLSETEDRLLHAQQNWEQRFMENKQRQLKELAEAEKRKEELESHIRVMQITDANVSLSPYQSNFLEELEGVLTNDGCPVKPRKMTKEDLTVSMNQIYEIMSTLRPTVDDVEENVKLLFARVNKLLLAFESALSNSLSKSTNQKSVTFKL